MGNKIYFRCWVEDDGSAIPGNRLHCPIANAIILADPDILRPWVDENVIYFTRRSDNYRYRFVTPEEAVRFIREFDRFVEAPDGGGRVRKMSAYAFELILTSKDLISIEERQPSRQRSAAYAVRATAERAYGPTFSSVRAEIERGMAEIAEPVPAAAASKPHAVSPVAPAKRKASAPRKRLSQRV